MIGSRANWTAGIAVASTLAIAVGTQADDINTLMTSGGVFPANVIGSDENREEVFHSGTPTSTIDVGDVVHGIIAFEQLYVDPPGTGQIDLDHVHGNSELGGEFSLLVTAKVADPANPGKFAFTFGPDPAFDTGGVGTLIRLYEDATPGLSTFNVDGGGSKAVATASVTDGALYVGLGLSSPGNFYHAYGNGVISGPNATLRVGDVFFALDRTEAGVGSALTLAPIVQIADLGGLGLVAGIGEIIGTGEIGPRVPGSPWELGSNTQFALTIVPEPATMGMMALGVLAMWPRRRSSR
jgi:hypothetical protein